MHWTPRIPSWPGSARTHRGIQGFLRSNVRGHVTSPGLGRAVYARLYKYTKDEHYLDVARVLCTAPRPCWRCPDAHTLAGRMQQEHWRMGPGRQRFGAPTVPGCVGFGHHLNGITAWKSSTRSCNGLLKAVIVFHRRLMMFNLIRSAAARWSRLVVLGALWRCGPNPPCATAAAPVRRQIWRGTENPLPTEAVARDGSRRRRPRGRHGGREGDSHTTCLAERAAEHGIFPTSSLEIQAVKFRGGRLPGRPTWPSTSAFYMSGNSSPLYRAPNILGTMKFWGMGKRKGNLDRRLERKAVTGAFDVDIFRQRRQQAVFVLPRPVLRTGSTLRR